MTQKRVGLGEPETERLKNELQKNKKDSSNTCVTSAWEMTRFHQMPSWPLGPSVFPQEFQSRNGEDMASLMAFDPLILRDRWPLSIIIGGWFGKMDVQCGMLQMDSNGMCDILLLVHSGALDALKALKALNGLNVEWFSISLWRIAFPEANRTDMCSSSRAAMSAQCPAGTWWALRNTGRDGRWKMLGVWSVTSAFASPVQNVMSIYNHKIVYIYIYIS